MNRRGFLRSILAAGVAPYVQTAAGVLMPLARVHSRQINGIDHATHIWWRDDGRGVSAEFIRLYMENVWRELAGRGPDFVLLPSGLQVPR